MSESQVRILKQENEDQLNENNEASASEGNRRITELKESQSFSVDDIEALKQQVSKF